MLAHELRRRVAALRVLGEAIGVAGSGQADRLRKRFLDELTELEGFGVQLLDQPGDRDNGPADVVAITQRAVASVRAALGAEIHCSAEASSMWVRLSAPMLRHAVENLIDNAVRHGAASEVEVSIRSVGSPRGSVAEVVVADRGPGLVAAPRREPTHHEGRGTRPGRRRLGLGIVEWCLEPSGARLWMANRPGGGAAFTLRLPGVTEQHTKTTAGGRVG